MLKVAREVIIIEQDTVLESLMPSLDLALCLRVVRCAAHMAHTFVREEVRQFTATYDAPLSDSSRGL